MTITLGIILTVAAILFTIGIFGIFLNRKNVIIILMSIELMLLAVNINFVAFSAFLDDLVGPGLRAPRADRRRRRGGDRPCHPRHLFPQPRLDRGRRHQSDEGLSGAHVSAHRLPAAHRRAHRRARRHQAFRMMGTDRGRRRRPWARHGACTTRTAMTTRSRAIRPPGPSI